MTNKNRNLEKALEKEQVNIKEADKKPGKRKSSKSPRRIIGTIALTLAVIISGGVAVVTAVAVLDHTRELRESREEFDYLRELSDSLEADSESGRSALEIEMLGINPHYVAWIRIDGTNIDYPVVRTSDNERYLNTSFHGEENRAGTLFMDYRNTGNLLNSNPGDEFRHILIYGHNLREGGMFTDLQQFLDAAFLQANRMITLIVNDQEIQFEIFSARLTDINDPAYFLYFDTPQTFIRFADRIGAPLAATQILTLSTCVIGGNDDARVIVQGHRIIN